MLELVKLVLNTLHDYGAETEDTLFFFYHCIGLIPLCVYCWKYKHEGYTVFTNVVIHLIRTLLFVVAFFIYVRYGFTNYLIKWNSLVLILYTIVGYYYWTHKELLYWFNLTARNILKYIFYSAVCIESIYILTKWWNV